MDAFQTPGININPIAQVLMKQGQARRKRAAEQQQQEQDKLNKSEALYTSAIMKAADPDRREALLLDARNKGVFDDDDLSMWEGANQEELNWMLADKLTADGFGELLPEQYRSASNNEPSSVRETQWFMNQSDDVKEAHLKLKRGLQLTPEEKLAYEKSLADIRSEAEGDKARSVIEAEAGASDKSADTATKVEAGKKLGILRGNILADETKSFRDSRSKKLQLNQLENALNDSGTGKYSQLKAFAGKYLPGVDVDNEQALQSIITQYALDELRTQPGPKTDFDFIKAAETQIQAGNTKGANKIILDRMKENQKYADARWKAFSKFKGKNKNFEDFEDTFNYESDYNANNVSQEQAQLPPTNANGWVLMEDANGNKAYVSPDGSQFEEVK